MTGTNSLSTTATLTKSGRAAMAAALAAQPLHLAVGSGDPAWDSREPEIIWVNQTSLILEIGRRQVNKVSFALPDENGEIESPRGMDPDGTVRVARYRLVDDPTPYLFIRTAFDFSDASNAVLRELGLFMGTTFKPDLPPGQRYFRPEHIESPGILVAVQRLHPPVNRAPNVRHVSEFVFEL